MHLTIPLSPHSRNMRRLHCMSESAYGRGVFYRAIVRLGYLESECQAD